MPVDNAAAFGAERQMPKCRILRRLKYLLAGLTVLVVSLAIIGGIYQSVKSSHDLRTYTPPGVFVGVTGYKMHIHCVGDGGPTVILESGLNGRCGRNGTRRFWQ